MNIPLRGIALIQVISIILISLPLVYTKPTHIDVIPGNGFTEKEGRSTVNTSKPHWSKFPEDWYTLSSTDKASKRQSNGVMPGNAMAWRYVPALGTTPGQVIYSIIWTIPATRIRNIGALAQAFEMGDFEAIARTFQTTVLNSVGFSEYFLEDQGDWMGMQTLRDVAGFTSVRTYFRSDSVTSAVLCVTKFVFSSIGDTPWSDDVIGASAYYIANDLGIQGDTYANWEPDNGSTNPPGGWKRGPSNSEATFGYRNNCVSEGQTYECDMLSEVNLREVLEGKLPEEGVVRAKGNDNNSKRQDEDYCSTVDLNQIQGLSMLDPWTSGDTSWDCGY